MKSIISSKGQLILPAPLRQQDSILPGQTFQINRLESGKYLLQRDENGSGGLLDWLQACPSKEWFQPLASESTDTL